METKLTNLKAPENPGDAVSLEYFNSNMAGIIPDYSLTETTNRISAANGTWTVDRNGFVILSCNLTNTSSNPISFLINNKIVSTMAFSQVSVNEYCHRNTLPVSKGDVVKIQVGASYMQSCSCYFIPSKTVISNIAREYTMTPDYSAMETTNRISTNNGTWTVDRDGFVRVGAIADANSLGAYVDVFINDKEASIDGTSNPASNVIHRSIYAVKAGDVVRVRSRDGNNNPSAGSIYCCYFIPPKAIPSPYIDETYSTTEINTGKTWIDGKPIYRRVFTGTITAAANTNTSIELGQIVDSIVSFGGMYATDSSGNKYSMPYVIQNGTVNFNAAALWIRTTEKMLMFASTLMSQRTDSPYRIWVEYTKI